MNWRCCLEEVRKYSLARHDRDAVDASLEARLHARTLCIALGAQLLYARVDFDLQVRKHIGLGLGRNPVGNVGHDRCINNAWIAASVELVPGWTEVLVTCCRL